MTDTNTTHTEQILMTDSFDIALLCVGMVGCGYAGQAGEKARVVGEREGSGRKRGFWMKGGVLGESEGSG
jgi:hypothetical protein